MLDLRTVVTVSTIVRVDSLVAAPLPYVTVPAPNGGKPSFSDQHYRSTIVMLHSDDEATRDDSEPAVDSPAEVFARIRQRARDRTSGAPMHEWSKTSDHQTQDMPAHEPVPPTPEQAAAVDALFRKLLRDRGVPNGFGEGLDRLIDGEDDPGAERMQHRDGQPRRRPGV